MGRRLLPRGHSLARARPPRAPLLLSLARDRSRRRLVSPTAAGHRDAELFLARRRRVLTDDLAFVHDEDPVGQGEDLLELERDEQDPTPLVALLDEPPVNELDRADVEPARRLGGDQDLRVTI